MQEEKTIEEIFMENDEIDLLRLCSNDNYIFRLFIDYINYSAANLDYDEFTSLINYESDNSELPIKFDSEMFNNHYKDFNLIFDEFDKDMSTFILKFILMKTDQQNFNIEHAFDERYNKYKDAYDKKILNYRIKQKVLWR